MAVESTQPKTRFIGTLTLTAGSLAAYTGGITDGNITFSGLTAAQKEKILVEHRGNFSTLVAGKQKYVSYSATFKLCDLVDPTDVTLVGLLLQKGAHAAALSTLGANRPYCIDILWTMLGTLQGDAANHTMLVEDCSVDDVNFTEGDVNEVTFSGIAYGAITMA
ncbi:MAG: hypothetical protein Q8P18_18365 [Pseudomonadota bacterium]|nr:hypothetical protein [Pseudomonadota bacterium]